MWAELHKFIRYVYGCIGERNRWCWHLVNHLITNTQITLIPICVEMAPAILPFARDRVKLVGNKVEGIIDVPVG